MENAKQTSVPATSPRIVEDPTGAWAQRTLFHWCMGVRYVVIVLRILSNHQVSGVPVQLPQLPRGPQGPAVPRPMPQRLCADGCKSVRWRLSASRQAPPSKLVPKHLLQLPRPRLLPRGPCADRVGLEGLLGLFWHMRLSTGKQNKSALVPPIRIPPDF